MNNPNLQSQGNPNKIRLGLISKCFIILMTINYLGYFINKNYILIFANIPLFTIFQLELYRLFTSAFLAENIIELIFNFFIILTIINYWENKDGTAKFCIKFFLNYLTFQFCLLLIYIILYIIFPSVLIYKIKIIPLIGISYLVKYMLLTNTKKLFLIKNKEISDRLLIVLYIIGFILLTGKEIRLEFFLSFYFGFLICKYPKIYDIYIFEEESILHFEKNEKYSFIVNINGYIHIDYIGKNNINTVISEKKSEENKVIEDQEELKIIESVQI